MLVVLRAVVVRVRRRPVRRAEPLPALTPRGISCWALSFTGVRDFFRSRGCPANGNIRKRGEKSMRQLRSRAGRRRNGGAEVGKPRQPSAETSEKAAAAALTLQLLGFVADGRTYGETMEAWRSTCPRMPIWENAVCDGLVRIENGGAMKSSRVVLTARGKARLSANGRYGSKSRLNRNSSSATLKLSQI